MANKRQIKKQIHYACGSLASQCIIAGECINGIDEKAMSEIIVEIAKLQETSLERCSFAFDKSIDDFDSKQAYNTARSHYNHDAFRVLIKEFNERVAEILHEMNTHLTPEQREANKKAAATE